MDCLLQAGRQCSYLGSLGSLGRSFTGRAAQQGQPARLARTPGLEASARYLTTHPLWPLNLLITYGRDIWPSFSPRGGFSFLATVWHCQVCWFLVVLGVWWRERAGEAALQIPPDAISHLSLHHDLFTCTLRVRVCSSSHSRAKGASGGAPSYYISSSFGSTISAAASLWT
jgi:hypothetical protein